MSTISAAQLSPLELAHPLGRADRVLLIGDGCPSSLVPGDPEDASAEAGIVILAPGPREARNDRWLDSAGRRAANALACDGLAYVVAPALSRGKLVAALRNAGAVETTPFVHLPNPTANRLIVPISAPLVRYALAHVVGVRASVSATLGAGLRIPHAANLASALLGPVAVAVRHPHGRPLFNWLFELSGAAPSAGTALIVRSWRGVHHGMVVHCFADGAPTPSAIAKIGSSGDSAEGMRLAALGPAARAAGARVAEVLASTSVRGRPLVLQTAISGQLLARFLSRNRQEVGSAFARVADWLLAWNVATARRAPRDPDLLEHAVIAPARDLAPHIDDSSGYLDWLATRCGSIASSPLPLVAAHHDLTMWNLVLDENGVLGVHDWEAAEESALPLGDVFYSLADAAAAGRRYRSRVEAARSCFERGGHLAPLVAEIVGRFRETLGLTRDVTELCFHACWLHHAANEQRRTDAGQERPFLEIVRWAAAARPQLP
jgi:hypothetical protein